jgi:hypothetical protein
MSATNDYNTYQLPLFPDTVTVPNTGGYVNITNYTLYPKTLKSLYWELIQRELADLSADVNDNTKTDSGQPQRVSAAINRIQELMYLHSTL